MTMADVRIARPRKRASSPEAGDGPRPIRSLRAWLDHLAARDRLAVIRDGVALRFELAAIAKRLEGIRATLFPRPDGHRLPVVCGLMSNRAWIADAMGVAPCEVLARFQDAALDPLPWREVKSAPAQEVVDRDIDLAKLLPLPTHNEHDSGPYITAGLVITRNPATGEASGVGGRCRTVMQIAGPPTPDPSPPLASARGGRGA